MDGVASPASSPTTLSDESPAIGDVSIDLKAWKYDNEIRRLSQKKRTKEKKNQLITIEINPSFGGDSDAIQQILSK